MDYYSLNYPSPHDYCGKHTGESFLIIGSGPSTKKLIQYKDKIADKFDQVISINLSINDFKDQSTYFFAIEKNPALVYNAMNQNKNYRKDITYFVHWKCIDKFPGDIKKVKMTRIFFGDEFDIREYIKPGKEGLVIGPKDTKGISAGTASLQAIHLASIMGASSIYLIGCDLMFKEESRDHYYQDNFFYRKSKTKESNRSPIVDVVKDGTKYKSTEFFRESAKFIDKLIEQYYNKENVEIIDFSDGLIQKAKKADLDAFFSQG